MEKWSPIGIVNGVTYTNKVFFLYDALVNAVAQSHGQNCGASVNGIVQSHALQVDHDVAFSQRNTNQVLT